MLLGADSLFGRLFQEEEMKNGKVEAVMQGKSINSINEQGIAVGN